MPEQWTDLDFFSDGSLENLSLLLVEELNKGHTILPTVSNIFRAIELTPLHKVCCVILGQDPYSDSSYANGLAFSVNKNVSPLPKSLQNIYKELYTDVGVTRGNGDLTDWAQQGVLLLNTCLTVREGEASSHSSLGWQELTNQIIQTISDQKDGVVFILWGKQAQAKEPMIDKTKHLVLEAPHPSPLSAYRGFFGSRPFSKTNDYLRNKAKQPIDW